MNRIPFSLPDVGLREIKGEVYLSDTFLVLEIEDSLMGEFDRDIITIEIEVGALDEVRFEKRFFKDRLVLRPRTRQLLDSVPGDHGREIALSIWRKYRPGASRLSAELRRRSLENAG